MLPFVFGDEEETTRQTEYAPQSTSYNTASSTEELSIASMNSIKRRALSCKHLDDTVAARADHESSVAAPADVADAFAPHSPVRYDILGANSLLERPETDAGVVAGGDGFTAVFGEAEC